MKALTQHEVGERDYVTWDILAAYPSSGVLAEHDAKVRADERERCARIAEEEIPHPWFKHEKYVRTGVEIATVIREGKSDA